MGVVILVLVVIAALFAVVSGVWVALALITAISEHNAEQMSSDSDKDI